MKKRVFLIFIATAFLTATGTATINPARAATTRNFNLYGSGFGATNGWGLTSSNITSPGPTIVVEVGDTINLTLTSVDGFQHQFFVSYTNATTPSTGNPESSPFTGTVNYQFVVTSTVGTYTYRCAIHPTIMWGYLQVVPAGTIPEVQPLALASLFFVVTLIAALVCRKNHIT
jgi:plastocyanin